MARPDAAQVAGLDGRRQPEGVVIPVLLVVLWFLSVVALWFVALEQEFGGNPIVAAMSVIAGVLLLSYGIWLGMKADEAAMNRCRASGIAWTQTDTIHGMVMAGNVMVPTTYPIYGCVEVGR